MSVTWGKWVDAWKQGTNTNDSSHIEAVITQDFKWKYYLCSIIQIYNLKLYFIDI